MKRYLIVFIILIAAFLRLYQITAVPPSPSLDEVSLGYNAYSLLQTGKDEYGASFPLLLRAYDDWRPALYVYVVMPFVRIFGLTPLAVRLPSVLLSLITLYITYFIGSMIGKKYLKTDILGIIASTLVAVSPWHIYISRLGHEVNLGLTLFVAAICFFLDAAERERKWSLVASGVLFGLSLHGYQSEKLTTPFVIVLGVLLYWKNLRKIPVAQILLAVFLFIAVAVPAAIVTFSGQGLSRFQGTSAVASGAPVFRAAQQSFAAAKQRGDIVDELINYRGVVAVKEVAGNYLSNFAPKWLFWGREREAHKVPGMGLLYFWEAPFIVMGLWALWKRKLPGKISLFLIGWMLIAPVPAAITTQAPHAMRSFTFIPVLELLEGFGLIALFELLNQEGRTMIGLGVTASALIGLSIFWQGYFVIFPNEQSDAFQYAIKDAVRYVSEKGNAYDKIVFATDGSLTQSYMFFLFYSRYDPSLYQEEGGTMSGSFAATHRFGKYEFREISSNEPMNAKTLLLVDSNRVPSVGRGINSFVNKDGKTAIVALSL